MRPATVEGEGPIRTYFRVLHREIVGYQFAVHHTIPLVGIILGLAASDTSMFCRRLWRLSGLWVLFWWLMIPLTAFRPFRYAYLAPPVVILGVLGFHRWAVAAQALRMNAAAIAASVWLMAMWSMWLSDRTGVPARLWLPAIGAACLGGLILAHRRRLIVPAFARAPLIIGLAAVTVQVMPYTRWQQRRTHFVVDAEHRLEAVSLAGYVCGLEAPNLLLARPANGPALSSNYVWNPDCRIDGGRLARYVVVPDAEECTAYESPFVRENHAALARLPSLVTVQLPPWRGTGSRSCRYSVVALPEGIIQPP